MPIFSKDFNIKIINNEDIIDKLKKIKSSGNKQSISEMYFIDNSTDISKYNSFSKLDNYVTIIKEDNKYNLKLVVNNKEYITSVNDLLSGIQILFTFNYSFIFSINYELYTLLLDNILIYIIHTDNNEYYIAFNECVTNDKVTYILEELKIKYNFEFDDNLFFDIKEDKFTEYKNSRGDI